MSQCENFSDLPCCSSPEIVVDNVCENLYLVRVAGAGTIIWSDPTPLSGVFTFSLSPDSPSGATFTLLRPTVPSGTINTILNPGESSSQIAANVNSVRIQPVSLTEPVIGDVSITVLRKISEIN
ncbi:hypothetical protein Q0N71_23245 [Bacillus thuringiensis]|uniref:S-Ena type endospore appendage n=1 Tax=Bacillus thuringiensis TaxID=1428 RepID=UPI003459348B